MPTHKNWDQIARDLSVEYDLKRDSDEDDSLNVMSVQRNAHRVAEMMREVVPAVPGLTLPPARPPVGANDYSFVKTDFSRIGTDAAAAVDARASHTPHASSSDSETSSAAAASSEATARTQMGS